MNQLKFDWGYVRRFTLIPSICAAVAAVSLSLAIWLHSEQVQRNDELTANHAAVHEDYDALIDQRRVVDRYQRRYQSFRSLGFIGRESRLDWVETLRTTTARVGIPRVSYNIQPQLQVVAPVTSLMSGEEIQIRVSRLQLEMGLIHELDLLRFFDDLQDQAPGLIKVDECELVYFGETSRTLSDPNLTTTCTVQIYSVITSDVAYGATG